MQSRILYQKGRRQTTTIDDLAVPRNIEEEVKDIERVYLYSIDDIEKITQDNLNQRKIEAEKALNMIVRETQKAVMLELKDVDFKSSTNREIINLLDSLSDEELASFHMENNHKDLIINILKNNAFYNDSFESIKKINLVDRHIVNSMVEEGISMHVKSMIIKLDKLQDELIEIQEILVTLRWLMILKTILH